MRWVVVLLMLANLVVFGWFRYSGAEAGAGALGYKAPVGDALRMLDVEESDSADEGRVALFETAGNRAQVVAPEVGMCGMIGAFSEQISARQVRDRLRAIGAIADVVEIPVPLRTDYWVHLGPYPSREAAMASLRELQKKGVDSFLIAEGELLNGISLGLFRQKASAEALLKERRAQGYDAALREIPRVASELWVVIKEGEELEESVRRQLLTVSPGTEYRKNLCSSIVTASKFE